MAAVHLREHPRGVSRCAVRRRCLVGARGRNGRGGVRGRGEELGGCAARKVATSPYRLVARTQPPVDRARDRADRPHARG